jgi:hypothetical protein
LSRAASGPGNDLEERRLIRLFDGTAAHEALKAARCLPDKPGRIEGAGLVVELGQHVRI